MLFAFAAHFGSDAQDQFDRAMGFGHEAFAGFDQIGTISGRALPDNVNGRHHGHILVA